MRPGGDLRDQILFFSRILATSVQPRPALPKRALNRSKKHSFPLVMPGQPLHPSDEVPRSIRDLLVRARTSWLKSEHVLDILTNYLEYNLQLAKDAPNRPPGGTLFLFDRRAVRFFRKDGHAWRKKHDGKTIRETHEKLKVYNQDKLNCYYAHGEERNSLQRRVYWLLEGDDTIVLVHYLGNAPTQPAPFTPGRTTSVSNATLPPPPLPSGYTSTSQPSQDLTRRASRGLESDDGTPEVPLQIGIVVTTGAEAFECTPSPVTNVPAGMGGGMEVPSPFANQGRALSQSGSVSNGMAETSAQTSPLQGPERAASLTLQRASSARVVVEGPHRLGPLHTAPSFEGPTVQTGETMDGFEAALQRQSSGAAILSRPSSSTLEVPFNRMGFDNRQASMLRQSSAVLGAVDVLAGFNCSPQQASLMEEDPQVVVTISTAPVQPQPDDDLDPGGYKRPGDRRDLRRSSSGSHAPRQGLRSASSRQLRPQDGLIIPSLPVSQKQPHMP